MTPSTILVVVADPGQPALAMRIEPSLEALQKLVGGNIEAVHFRFGQGSNIYFYCNEDGKSLGLAHNMGFGFDVVVGPIVISSADSEGEEIGVTEDQAPLIMRAVDRLRGIVRPSRSYVKGTESCPTGKMS